MTHGEGMAADTHLRPFQARSYRSVSFVATFCTIHLFHSQCLTGLQHAVDTCFCKQPVTLPAAGQRAGRPSGGDQACTVPAPCISHHLPSQAPKHWCHRPRHWCSHWHKALPDAGGQELAQRAADSHGMAHLRSLHLCLSILSNHLCWQYLA